MSKIWLSEAMAFEQKVKIPFVWGSDEIYLYLGQVRR